MTLAGEQDFERDSREARRASYPPLLLLRMPSRADNVALVRHAIAGLAEGLGMEEPGVFDLKTVVTEACMNVVAHAYDGDGGPLEVAAAYDHEGLLVTVRDDGRGIRPRPALGEPSLRLGLSLIATLSSRFEISGGAGRGTEVRMRLGLDANGDSPEGIPAVERIADVAAGTSISVLAGPLAGAVVSRVISVLAARADLSVDRLGDAVLLGDAIAAHAADDFPEGRMEIVVEERPGRVDVRLGPLREGTAGRIREAMKVPALNASLEVLADDVRVEQGDGGEYLSLAIAQRGS